MRQAGVLAGGRQRPRTHADEHGRQRRRRGPHRHVAAIIDHTAAKKLPPSFRSFLLCPCALVPVCPCALVSLCSCASRPCALVSLCPCALASLCSCASRPCVLVLLCFTPLRPCALVPLCPCARASLCPCTSRPCVLVPLRPSLAWPSFPHVHSTSVRPSAAAARRASSESSCRHRPSSDWCTRALSPSGGRVACSLALLGVSVSTLVRRRCVVRSFIGACAAWHDARPRLPRWPRRRRWHPHRTRRTLASSKTSTPRSRPSVSIAAKHRSS